MIQAGNATSLAEIRAIVRHLDEKLASVDVGAGVGAASGGSALSERLLEQILEFVGTMIATVEFDSVIDKTLGAFLALTKSEHVFLMTRGLEKGFVEKFRGVTKEDGNLWAYENLARTTANKLLDTDQPVFVPQVAQDDYYRDEAEAYELDLASLLCIPLKNGTETIGALYLDRKKSIEPFSFVDLNIVQALSSIAARALTNARMLHEQNERRQHLEMLNRLYAALSKTLNFDQMLDQIAQITLDVTKAERAFILMINQNNRLTPVIGRNAEGPLPREAMMQLSSSVCNKVLTTKEGVYLLDVSQDEEFAKKLSVVNLKLNSVVAVPLKGKEGVIGVLYIDSRTKAMDSLEKELSILMAIANVASMSVENAKLFRKATVDGMTGLYVRSFFMSRFEEEVVRCRRYGRVFSLLVTDIDKFKNFNDTYGHQTGDEVIKLVSNVIKGAIRAGADLPGRYGGEELVVLLPETDTPGAMTLAERIRERVEKAALKGPNGEKLSVTISIGVATFPAMGDSTASLFEHADQALYASKQGGRNRVTLWTDNLPRH